MKWKTRFIKISNDLKYFQICKHNVNAFDIIAQNMKYSDVRSIVYESISRTKDAYGSIFLQIQPIPY